MAIGKKKIIKAPPKPEKIDPSSHPALENLVERLSSPRLRAPGTLTGYLITANNFLKGLKGDQVPTESNFRRYFIRRRQKGISENTLRKEFSHLKKLAQANKWTWPFDTDDTPYPEEEPKPKILLPAQVEHLILARAELSAAERFYLAIATTWIVRREDLSRIKKRDYDDTTFIIHHSKRGRKVKHLIPDVLKPVFAAYRPKDHPPAVLSEMFQRICRKAGLEREKGMGWHSIRHNITTMIATLLPRNNYDPALIADYSGWSKKSLGSFFGGVSMVGVYRHPEILDKDPYGIDRLVYGIHPYLSFWSKKR